MAFESRADGSDGARADGANAQSSAVCADDADAASGAAPQPVQVRSNFAETAYWSPAVITEDGKATVKVTFPDSPDAVARDGASV